MNKKKILKLKPHFEYRVWANDNIKKIFNLNDDLIGEAWLISCFKDKSSIIENDENNLSLYDFYNDPKNEYFFDGYNIENKYPLLAKIIDAKQDLSVQIHPDDEYAKQFKSLGKTECWYVLDTCKNNSVILGHSAKNKDDFKNKVLKKQWDCLLINKPIKQNDFIYVPAKKIHAIKANTLIYEMQQSSNITYRVYDYERLDKGKLRELHHDHVYNLIKTPDFDLDKREISSKNDYLVYNEQFKLKLIENNSKKTYYFDEAKWIQLSIISGQAIINGVYSKQFDSLLIAHKEEIEIDGNCKCLISYI